MTQRTNHTGGNFFEAFFRSGLRIASLSKTVTDNEAIVATWPTILNLDPNGGAKDVLLPAEATSDGLTFIVRNKADAAENLVLKNSGDTQTVVTLAQGESAMVSCVNGTWLRVL